MDTKDIVDAHVEKDVDDVSVDQLNTTSSSRLQQIEDDTEGLPLPMGMAEIISNAIEPPKQKIGKVEQLDDNDGPEPPTAMLEESLNAADPNINNKISETISNNLSSINELNPPTPFNSVEFEEQDSIAKKKARDVNKTSDVSTENNGLVPSNRDSIYEVPREITEEEEVLSRGMSTANRRGWNDIESRAAHRDIESQTRNDNHDTADSINNVQAADEVPSSINQGLHEVEA